MTAVDQLALEVEVAALSTSSPPAAVLAALARVKREAGRTSRLDGLGRESATWRDLHGLLDQLLTLWEQVRG